MKLIVIPKRLNSTRVPLNMEEHQTTIRPPEAPTEGEKAKLSNLRGQNFLTSRRSKFSHLVSCRQMMEQPLSSIFARTSRCLSAEFKPRTFQHNTRQLR